MTDAELQIQDEKMRAEIGRMMAETAKLQSETAKILMENRWYPAVIASGATLAIVAIAKLFL